MLRSLWYEAQKVIDETGSDYSELQRNFEWFTLGKYGHRLLFHWVFNNDPKHHKPLVEQVHKCLKGRPDSAVQERKFFDYLTNIQSCRNGQLIDAVTRVTKISGRGYDRAIATIVHDIHLLDDYSTPNTQALHKIDGIERREKIPSSDSQ